MHGVLRRASLATVVLTLLLAATAHAAVISPPLRTSGAKIVDRDGRHGRAPGRQLVRLRDQRPRGPRALVARLRRHARPDPRGWASTRSACRSRCRRWTPTPRSPGIDFSERQERRAAGQDAAAGDGRRSSTPPPAQDLLVLLDNHSAGRRRLPASALWYGQAATPRTTGSAAWQALAAPLRRTGRTSSAPTSRTSRTAPPPGAPAARRTGGGPPSAPGNAITAHRAELAHRRRGHREARRRPAARPALVGRQPRGRAPRTRCASSGQPARLLAARVRPGRLPAALVQSARRGERARAPLARRLRLHRRSRGSRPLLVGEFGGREVDLDSVEGRWQRQFMDYLARTGHLLDLLGAEPGLGRHRRRAARRLDDADAAKLGLLQRTIRRQRIGYVEPAESADAAITSLSLDLRVRIG